MPPAWAEPSGVPRARRGALHEAHHLGACKSIGGDVTEAVVTAIKVLSAEGSVSLEEQFANSVAVQPVAGIQPGIGSLTSKQPVETSAGSSIGASGSHAVAPVIVVVVPLGHAMQAVDPVISL